MRKAAKQNYSFSQKVPKNPQPKNRVPMLKYVLCCLWLDIHTDKQWRKVKIGNPSQSFKSSPFNLWSSSSLIVWFHNFFQFHNIFNPYLYLLSQLFPPVTGQDYCLTFWYHMYGQDIGSLKVTVMSNASYDVIRSDATVWELKGQSGDQWLPAQVNISHVYTGKPFRVWITTGKYPTIPHFEVHNLWMLSTLSLATKSPRFHFGQT